MSQDYTVAKELASLKEIKQSAEQRISDLSLNALNYVNDHRLHKADGGGTGGGGNVMIVTLTYDEDADDGTYTSSASATEIVTANSEGKVVIGKDGGNPFFVSVFDFMGTITINGIQLIRGNGTVIYHLFSMDITTNKWTDTLL